MFRNSSLPNILLAFESPINQHTIEMSINTATYLLCLWYLLEYFNILISINLLILILIRISIKGPPKLWHVPTQKRQL